MDNKIKGSGRKTYEVWLFGNPESSPTLAILNF